MTATIPDGFHSWSIEDKDAFWRTTWTPEQRVHREELASASLVASDYRCRRHPEVPVVLTIDPDLLYCHLCMVSRRYDEFDEVKDEGTEDNA